MITKKRILKFKAKINEVLLHLKEKFPIFKNEREFHEWFIKNYKLFELLEIESNNKSFPDIIGIIKRGYQLKIELEYQAKNYIMHGHPLDKWKADLIIAVYSKKEEIRGIPVIYLFKK